MASQTCKYKDVAGMGILLLKLRLFPVELLYEFHAHLIPFPPFLPLSLSPGPHLIPISLPLSVLLYKNILSSIVEEDLNVSLRRNCWHGPTCQIFFN